METGHWPFCMTLTSLIGIDSSNPETGKKASQSFVYDATNRLVEGTNWKGDKSAYSQPPGPL